MIQLNIGSLLCLGVTIFFITSRSGLDSFKRHHRHGNVLLAPGFVSGHSDAEEQPWKAGALCRGEVMTIGENATHLQKWSS
jgi:hypothetical protein